MTPIGDLIFLGICFMLMTLFAFTIYGLFAGHVRTYVVNSPKNLRGLQRGFATVFALLGAKLALSER